VQIRHASGGASEGEYWVPQAVQMKAVMRGEYTVALSRALGGAGGRAHAAIYAMVRSPIE
jgi:hypothetical protein